MGNENKINTTFLASIANACEGCQGIRRKINKETLSRVREETLAMIKEALVEMRNARDTYECSRDFCDYVSDMLNRFSLECLRCKRKTPAVSDHIHFYFLDPYEAWVEKTKAEEMEEGRKDTLISTATRSGSVIRTDPKLWSGGGKKQRK